MNSASASAPPTAPPVALSASLRRLCAVVRAMAALCALALLLGVPYVWASPERIAQAWGQMNGLGGHALTVDARAQALGGALLALAVGVALFALWQLWQLFGDYAQGRVFSRAALGRLRRFAFGVVALGALAPLVRALMVMVLTLGNPPGQRLLTLGLSSDDFLSLLVGLVLVAIAAVMGEAVRLAEDHAGFV